MSKRPSLLAFTLIAEVVAIVHPVWAKPQHSRSLVFILPDDQGYGDLGCFGQKLIQTPVLDRMAAEGIWFTHFK